MEDRDQHLEALRSPRVRRQDRGREADAVGIIGGCTPVANARLAHGHGTDAGHHLALGQAPMADNALAPVLGLEIGMLGKKIGDLGLDRLGQQRACAVAQHLSEWILECSWLNQPGDVIVRHGISLLQWRVRSRTTPRYAAFTDSGRHQLPRIAPAIWADRHPTELVGPCIWGVKELLVVTSPNAGA